MKDENKPSDEIEFDEDAAICFILRYLPVEDRKGLRRTTIQYILDCIYDYYESEGLISEDNEQAEGANIDEEDMFNFIHDRVAKDKRKISDTLIQEILAGEYEYGVSIGIYEADDED